MARLAVELVAADVTPIQMARTGYERKSTTCDLIAALRVASQRRRPEVIVLPYTLFPEAEIPAGAPALFEYIAGMLATAGKVLVPAYPTRILSHRDLPWAFVRSQNVFIGVLGAPLRSMGTLQISAAAFALPGPSRSLCAPQGLLGVQCEVLQSSSGESVEMGVVVGSLLASSYSEGRAAWDAVRVSLRKTADAKGRIDACRAKNDLLSVCAPCPPPAHGHRPEHPPETLIHRPAPPLR